MFSIRSFKGAVGTGEVLRVRYAGGSQPNTVRDLQILSVDETYISAVCLATGTTKTYRVDRAEIVVETTPLSYFAPRLRNLQVPKSAPDFSRISAAIYVPVPTVDAQSICDDEPALGASIEGGQQDTETVAARAAPRVGKLTFLDRIIRFLGLDS
jgi:hypothetical protein